MNELVHTLRALLEQLRGAAIDPKAAEAQALNRLAALLQAIENGERDALARHAENLRQFWLNQVPWCSDLSRQLERVLIQYDEGAQ